MSTPASVAQTLNKNVQPKSNETLSQKETDNTTSPATGSSTSSATIVNPDPKQTDEYLRGKLCAIIRHEIEGMISDGNLFGSRLYDVERFLTKGSNYTWSNSELRRKIEATSSELAQKFKKISSFSLQELEKFREDYIAFHELVCSHSQNGDLFNEYHETTWPENTQTYQNIKNRVLAVKASSTIAWDAVRNNKANSEGSATSQSVIMQSLPTASLDTSFDRKDISRTITLDDKWFCAYAKQIAKLDKDICKRAIVMHNRTMATDSDKKTYDEMLKYTGLQRIFLRSNGTYFFMFSDRKTASAFYKAVDDAFHWELPISTATAVAPTVTASTAPK